MTWIKFVPKNLLSYWVGKAAYLQQPRALIFWIMKSFAAYYKINLNEAAKPLAEYPSLGDFFVRELKPGVRPMGGSFYVHPSDSMMTARGEVTSDQLIQAKGRSYRLSEFLKESNIQRWIGGSFVTYYLCPTDYHRVHSPVSGVIKEVRYLPGQLWPVNDWSVREIENLFVVNERVVVEIETEQGPIAVVFVGATNVGSIRLKFEPEFKTNASHIREPKTMKYLNPIRVEKGEELGLFAMGSTVIIVASEQMKDLKKVIATSEPARVQVRQGI